MNLCVHYKDEPVNAVWRNVYGDPTEHTVLMHFQKTEEILNKCAVYAVEFNPTTWQQRRKVSDRGGLKSC